MRIVTSFAALLALAGAAAAQPVPPLATAGSNMPPDFYPKPKCEPAGAPPPKPGNDPDAMNIYNLRVRALNQKVAAFNVCMKGYVDNAQNDINTIQQQVHDAVAAANAR